VADAHRLREAITERPILPAVAPEDLAYVI
jgi:hypothetical protein